MQFNRIGILLFVCISLLLQVAFAQRNNTVTRRNFLKLPLEEQLQFIKGVQLLKSETDQSGWRTYDTYVVLHSSSSPYAHKGPAFLPWHRQFLLDFEDDMRRVLQNDSYAVPFWDWTDDSMRMNLWTGGLLGGNGTGPNNTIETGPFVQWPTIDIHGQPTTHRLVRTLGSPFVGMMNGMPMNNSFPNVLPEAIDVLKTLLMPNYDSAPYSDKSHDPPSFRNNLEGWELAGCLLHNRVHLWVGGQMGLVPISPNDPVFWLHHSFTDKIWSLWMELFNANQPNGGYVPETGAAYGHNLYDAMVPFGLTPADLAVPTTKLGYDYEQSYLDQYIQQG